MLATIAILRIGKALNFINFPNYSRDIPFKVCFKWFIWFSKSNLFLFIIRQKMLYYSIICYILKNESINHEIWSKTVKNSQIFVANWNWIYINNRFVRPFGQIWPLPVLYVGNLVCGLGGTKHLSLPMFTVLRRFTILMTLIGEYYVLKLVNNNYWSWLLLILIIDIILGEWHILEKIKIENKFIHYTRSNIIIWILIGL